MELVLCFYVVNVKVSRKYLIKNITFIPQNATQTKIIFIFHVELTRIK
jgi:hypothetical protein